MFGLPAELDLSFLVGPRLEQVAIGENEIIFGFELSISLNVQGDFSLGAQEAETNFGSPRDAAEQAVALLGHAAVQESHTLSGDLFLTFDDGTRLSLHDTSEHYESYQIKRADEIWVV